MIHHSKAHHHSEPHHLSSGFETYPENHPMSKSSLYAKSAAAITLGFIPFLVAGIALEVFKGLSYLGSKKKNGFAGKTLRILTGIPGVFAAGIMVIGAKAFSLTQTLVWRHYVKKPTGDGLNTRLAYYGSGNKPWHDFKKISQAFFNPGKLTASDRTLSDWAKVRV